MQNKRLVTHARVKFFTDSSIDIIPIEQILEFKKKIPKHIKDFDKKSVYRVLYSDKRNPDGLILKIQIADLACGNLEVEKLEKTRPKFARINDSDIPSTSFDDEEDSQNQNESDDEEISEDEEINLQQAIKAQKNEKRKLTIIKRGQAVIKKIRSDIPKITDELDDSNDLNCTYQNRSADGFDILKSTLPANEHEVQEKNNQKDNLSTEQSQPADPSTSSILVNHSANVSYDQINKDRHLYNSEQEQFDNNLHEQPNNIINRVENPGIGDPNPAIGDQNPGIEGELGANRFTDDYVTKLVINSIRYYKAKEGPAFQDRRRRYKADDHGDIYLGEGKSVKPDVWRMMQTEKATIFYKELLVKLWNPRDLANRALKKNKVTKLIPNRSPIKDVEQNLLRLSISLFDEFLEKQKALSSDEKAKLLRNSTRYITEKIRDLRDQAKRNYRRKKLRYN